MRKNIFQIFNEKSRLIIIAIIIISFLLLLYKNFFDVSSGSSLQNISYRWLFPLSIILTFFLCLFLDQQRRILFLIYFFTTVIALYSVEIILMNRTPSDIHYSFAKKHNLKYDSRSAETVLKDMAVNGIEGFPFSNGLYFEKDNIQSLSGVSGSNIIHCNETGEWVIYNSDEFGFNNPFGSFDIKNIQIVAIGDSFTNGYCLSNNLDFISLIRNEYPKTINLGMTATGPLRQLAILKEYAIFLKPNVLLWVFFEGNDLKELMNENQNSLLKKYLGSGFSQNLMKKQSQIDNLLKEYFLDHKIKKRQPDSNFSIDKFIFLDALRTNLGLYKEVSQTNNIDLKLLETILIQAKNITNDWGGKMIFVYIPSIERYMGFRERNRINKNRGEILEILKKIDVPLIDIHESISSSKDPLSFYNSRIGYHFNETGNKLLSEVVLDSLSSLKILYD